LEDESEEGGAPELRGTVKVAARRPRRRREVRTNQGAGRSATERASPWAAWAGEGAATGLGWSGREGCQWGSSVAAGEGQCPHRKGLRTSKSQRARRCEAPHGSRAPPGCFRVQDGAARLG
jgi:hypothetical protein